VANAPLAARQGVGPERQFLALGQVLAQSVPSASRDGGDITEFFFCQEMEGI